MSILGGLVNEDKIIDEAALVKHLEPLLERGIHVTGKVGPVEIDLFVELGPKELK